MTDLSPEDKRVLELLTKLMMNGIYIKDMWRTIHSELDKFNIEWPEDIEWEDSWKFLAVKYNLLTNYLDEEEIQELKEEYEIRSN